MSTFGLISRDISGHYASSIQKPMCTKIAIFLKNQAIFNTNCIGKHWFHGRYARSAEFWPQMWVAQKLQFFWTFFDKIDENRGNKHFLGQIPGNNGTIGGVQKIAKNWQKIELFSEKSLKIGGFEQFRPILWDITGTYVPAWNPRAKRRTHVHSAHRAAHYAQMQPRAARRAPAQGRIRANWSAHRSARAALRAF